jgi:AraC-like DNA-binding protein
MHDVACRHGQGRGRENDRARAHMLIFVRRGCFVRSAGSGEALLDPTVAYCVNPGEEERYDHPHPDGDDCTALSLDPDLLAGLWGGDPTLPTQPLPTAPALDIEHRLLLAAAGRPGDPHELVERAIALVAAVLASVDGRRVGAGRPESARRRRALVDATREALAVAPGRSLPDLADELAVSPHHLSRIFRSITGRTISRHACACAPAPRSSGWPAASTTSPGWRPTSASPTRATSAACYAARQDARRLRCGGCWERPPPELSPAVRGGASQFGAATGTNLPSLRVWASRTASG